jgi:hypothetical protein
MKYRFDAEIYKTGINWCVDVPGVICNQLIVEKGYIRIKGTINGFEFRKSLVPVKGKPYRLFVNLLMMKGGKTALGRSAVFEIEQDTEPVIRQVFPMHDELGVRLKATHLEENFESLTDARKRDIPRYLHQIKNRDILIKNIEKVIRQLENKLRDVRIP